MMTRMSGYFAVPHDQNFVNLYFFPIERATPNAVVKASNMPIQTAAGRLTALLLNPILNLPFAYRAAAMRIMRVP